MPDLQQKANQEVSVFHAGVPVNRFVQWIVPVIALSFLLLGLATPSRAGADTPGDLPRCRTLTQSIVKSDGSILAAGAAGISQTSCSYSRDHAMLIQLNSQGHVDPRFSEGGVALMPADFGNVVRLLPASSGRAVLVTSETMVRLNKDGSFDRTFNKDFVWRDFGDLFGDRSVRTATVGPDGKVVVVAGSGPDGIRVARFDADGVLDASFGGDGVIEPESPESDVTLRSVETAGFDPDGKLLLAGTAMEGDLGPLLFRYSSDGSPDGTFGAGDGFSAPWRNLDQQYLAGVRDLAVDSSGEIRLYAAEFYCCDPKAHEPTLFSLLFKMSPDGSASEGPVRLGNSTYWGARPSFVETGDGAVASNQTYQLGIWKQLFNGAAAPGFDSTALPVAPSGVMNGLTEGGDGSLIGVGDAIEGRSVITKVDATTGKPDPSFGTGGMVLLPANDCPLGVAPPPPGSPVTPWNRCRAEAPPAPSARVAFRNGASRKPVLAGTASLPTISPAESTSGARLKVKLPQRLKLNKRFRSKLDLRAEQPTSSDDVTIKARVQGRSIVVDVVPDVHRYSPEWGNIPSTAVNLEFKFKRGAIKRIPVKHRRKPMNFRVVSEVLPLDEQTGAPSIYYGENSTSKVLKVRPVKPRKRR